LIVAVVETRRTITLITADRVPTVRCATNVGVGAFVVIDALVPVTMLIESRWANTSEAAN